MCNKTVRDPSQSPAPVTGNQDTIQKHTPSSHSLSGPLFTTPNWHQTQCALTCVYGPFSSPSILLRLSVRESPVPGSRSPSILLRLSVRESPVLGSRSLRSSCDSPSEKALFLVLALLRSSCDSPSEKALFLVLALLRSSCDSLSEKGLFLVLALLRSSCDSPLEKALFLVLALLRSSCDSPSEKALFLVLALLRSSCDSLSEKALFLVLALFDPPATLRQRKPCSWFSLSSILLRLSVRESPVPGSRSLRSSCDSPSEKALFLVLALFDPPATLRQRKPCSWFSLSFDPPATLHQRKACSWFSLSSILLWLSVRESPVPGSRSPSILHMTFSSVDS